MAGGAPGDDDGVPEDTAVEAFPRGCQELEPAVGECRIAAAGERDTRQAQARVNVVEESSERVVLAFHDLEDEPRAANELQKLGLGPRVGQTGNPAAERS